MREAIGRSQQCCPHANCGCAPWDEHGPYCSLYCSNASRGETLEDPPGACACGHAACNEAQHAEPHGPGVETSVGRG